MRLVREIWSILTRTQKACVLAAPAVAVLMAFSTVSGIAAIAPFFAVLGEPQLIDRNGLLHWLYQLGGFASQRSFILALGMGFIVVVCVANLINLAGSVALDRLAVWIGN